VSITSMSSQSTTKMWGFGSPSPPSGGTMPPSMIQCEASMPLENGHRPLNR